MERSLKEFIKFTESFSIKFIIIYLVVTGFKETINTFTKIAGQDPFFDLSGDLFARAASSFAWYFVGIMITFLYLSRRKEGNSSPPNLQSGIKA